MYHSDLIIDQMAKDKMMAKQLDNAVSGVREQAINQAHKIQDGAQRLINRLSCFTDNYQDVCSKIKSEDARFFEGLVILVKDRNLIFTMLRIYFEHLLKSKTSNQLEYIRQGLTRAGLSYSVSSLTSQSFVIGITTAVCLSIRFNTGIIRYTSSASGWAVMGLTSYGVIQAAADSSERLMIICPWFYNALYLHKLNMMYFIVESYFMETRAFLVNSYSDDDLINLLINMLRT